MLNLFTKNYSLDLFPILLICLIPPALISGPAIPDIFLSLLGLIFIYKSITEKLKLYYFNFFTIWFLLFYLIIILSGLISVDPITSLIKLESIFYFRFYFFSLAISLYIHKYPNLLKYLALSLLITILIIVIDGSVEYFRGVSVFGVESGETRLFSLFIDEPIVGRYISSATMLFVCLMIYFYGYENNKIIFLVFCILMIGEVFTFMSGERSAFAMIVAFSFAGFILISKRRKERAIFLVFSAIFVLTLAFNQQRTTERVSQTFDEIEERDFKMIISSPVHEKHYSSAMKMFQEKPILGVGSNLFRHRCSEEKFITGPQSCTTHPHNYYIQLLAENGLVGFFLFFSITIVLSYLLTKHFIGIIFNKNSYKIDDQKLPVYLFLFVVITPVLPHGNFYNNWTNVTNFIGLGIFLSFFLKPHKS